MGCSVQKRFVSYPKNMYLQILVWKCFSKRKKKWMGTIAGSLSTNSPSFFQSGTSVFNEQGWWTLTFPRLSPNVLFQASKQNILFICIVLKIEKTCR